MIVKNVGDKAPDNFVIEKTENDKVSYYFDDDIEVIDGIKRSEQHDLLKNRAHKKQSRTRKIQRITVTTKAGNVFDGDEISQDRMARAIVVMDEVETIAWVLADNKTRPVRRSELVEALKLAGQEQARVWLLG